jgi:hypothetical protein
VIARGIVKDHLATKPQQIAQVQGIYISACKKKNAMLRIGWLFQLQAYRTENFPSLGIR